MPETPPPSRPQFAEVLDRVEDHVHVAGVLAEQHALELQRVLAVAGVAHLADAVDALVGVDADDGVVVIAADHRHAHVGDLQIRWARVGVDSIFNVSDEFIFSHFIHSLKCPVMRARLSTVGSAPRRGRLPAGRRPRAACVGQAHAVILEHPSAHHDLFGIGHAQQSFQDQAGEHVLEKVSGLVELAGVEQVPDALDDIAELAGVDHAR